MKDRILNASFRDPSGFLYTRDEKLYRQVNRAYRQDYDLLLSSGLYEKLVAGKLLIPHKEANVEPGDPLSVYKIIEPDRLAFISYRYDRSWNGNLKGQNGDVTTISPTTAMLLSSIRKASSLSGQYG